MNAVSSLMRARVAHSTFIKVKHRPPFQTRVMHVTTSIQRRVKDLFKENSVHKKNRAVIPVFMQAVNHFDRTAIVDQHGFHTYKDILHSAYQLADNILEIFETSDVFLNKERICFLCPNNISYVVAQWATWISGAMAVPLCTSHPSAELQYFIEDSQSKLVIYTEEFKDKMEPLMKNLSIPSLLLKKNDFVREGSISMVASENSKAVLHEKRDTSFKNFVRDNLFKQREALIIYTSGTTGKPKGVVHTHGSLDTHMQGMISTWRWSQSDVILHVLPLHHVHGVINTLMTPLYVGATCVMLPKFDAEQVWKELTNTSSRTTSAFPLPVSVFMAVPTIYSKLIEYFDANLAEKSEKLSGEFIKETCSSQVRLMVSGSAALPAPVMERWEQLTGHRLLERYGMTETGMVLTNSIHGPRHPGSLGNPFPGVQVCISKPNVYDEKGYDEICKGTSRRTVVKKGMENEQGELLAKGQNLFKCYWNRPDETQKAFTADGWFKTGDTAAYRDNVFKILGRTSVDIIKSGGYKISALEIERHLLAHPDLTDVAVVGIPDITWGQRVAVIVVTTDGKRISLEDLREFCKDRLAEYQMPTILKVLETMPRNAMGKVNKKELVTKVFSIELKKTY